MAVNWVTKTIKQVTHRKAIERWETEVRNREVAPQALWPIVKLLMKGDVPKAPSTVHGPLGITSLKKESQRDCRLFRKAVCMS
jgi:hypothetical protein